MIDSETFRRYCIVGLAAGRAAKQYINDQVQSSYRLYEAVRGTSYVPVIMQAQEVLSASSHATMNYINDNRIEAACLAAGIAVSVVASSFEPFAVISTAVVVNRVYEAINEANAND